MLTKVGDLFSPSFDTNAICLTTNGFVKKDGSCVMGRGVAKFATILWPGIQYDLGSRIKSRKNQVHSLGKRRFKNSREAVVLSFPVKHNWNEDADINLIKKSCIDLIKVADFMSLTKVWLPAMGCGNGNLSWEKLVKPAVSPILDDRFTIIFLKKDNETFKQGER